MLSINTKFKEKYFNILTLLLTIGFCFDIKPMINTVFYGAIIALVIWSIHDGQIKKIGKNLIERTNKTAIVLMLFFSGMLFVSALFSMVPDQGIGVADNYFKRMFIPFLLAWLIGYNKEKFEKFVYYGAIVSCIIITCSVFYEKLFLHIARPTGVVYTDPNVTAAVLLLLLPIILLLNYAKMKWRIGIGLLATIALFLTGSRGTVIAIPFIIFALFVWKYGFGITDFKTNKKQWQVFISLILIGMIFVCIFAANDRRYKEIWEYRNSFGNHYVGGDRLFLWESSLEMIRDYPVTGVGLNNFNKVYRDGGYIKAEAREPNLPSPHNIFLHIWVEAGLLGFIPFSCLIIYQLYYSWVKAKNDNNFALASFLIFLGMCISEMTNLQLTIKVYEQLYWFIWGCMCVITFNKSIKKYNNVL